MLPILIAFGLVSCAPTRTASIVPSTDPVIEDPDPRDPGGGGSGGGSGGTTFVNGTMVSSVDMGRGFSVTFASPVLAGQYANGDWWVEGPVSISAKTPASQTNPTSCQTGTGPAPNYTPIFSIVQRRVHGVMINPRVVGGVERQGYTSCLGRIYPNGEFTFDAGYSDAHNVGLQISGSQPLLVAPDSSVILSKAVVDLIPISGTGGEQTALESAAVLTVVTTQQATLLKNQAEGFRSFRPAYAGTDKVMPYTEQDLHYGILQNVAVPPGANPPTLQSAADRFQYVWLDHFTNWGARYGHPWRDMPGYGQTIAAVVGDGCAWPIPILPKFKNVRLLSVWYRQELISTETIELETDSKLMAARVAVACL